MVTWTTHRLVLRSASARAATGRERDFTAAILDSAGFLLVVLDEHGNIIRFNRRCEELTGRREDDVRGRPFFDVSPPPRAAASFPMGYENHLTDAERPPAHGRLAEHRADRRRRHRHRTSSRPAWT
jgi:PAS domain S-box-containing protein